jgi:hypothetical protein
VPNACESAFGVRNACAMLERERKHNVEKAAGKKQGLNNESHHAKRYLAKAL